MKKVAFQMYPMEQADHLTNNTLLLMQEAQDRGYEVWHFTPRDVFCQGDEVYANASPVTLQLDQEACYQLSKSQTTNLSTFNIIMIRQDPPFDMEYITSTYLLDQVKNKVLVVNDPTAIRDLPEKLYPLQFQEFIPPTLITYNQQQVNNFRAEQGDVVLKPLYGHHGHGIIHIHANDPYTLPKLQEPLIFQRYIPEIKQGNKRVVFINGEVAASIITIPGEGEFKIYRNSTDHAYELNTRDKEICNVVGKDLKQRDLVFVGIDIIGDYLTEINITSVGSIRRVNMLYNRKLEADIWDGIEARI